MPLVGTTVISTKVDGLPAVTVTVLALYPGLVIFNAVTLPSVMVAVATAPVMVPDIVRVGAVT